MEASAPPLGSLGDAAFHWLKSPVSKFEDQRRFMVTVDVVVTVAVVVVVAVMIVVAVDVVVSVAVLVVVLVPGIVVVARFVEVIVTVVADGEPKTKVLPTKARTTSVETLRAASTTCRFGN